MNRLLVIGAASVDRLHLQERTVESAGSAARYRFLREPLRWLWSRIRRLCAL